MNIISDTLNYSLNYYYILTGDVGIAIILLTISVRFLLMPLSLKQKFGMQKQQNISKGLQEIKEKYKNNKKKIDIETKKYFEQNSKGMWGCLTILLQIPVVFTLYNTILTLPMQVGTILVPWVTSLKMTDNYFIVPAIYVLSVIIPNIVSYIPFLRVTTQNKISKTNIIISSLVSALITFKAPVALGLYLITTSLFSFVEEIIFKLYVKKISYK